MWRSWLPVRLVLATATAVVIVVFLGFTEGESVAHGLVAVALAGPFWLVPVGLYLVVVRTRLGVVIVGTGLFVCVFLALRAVYADESSTAALGIVLFPIYFTIAVGACLAVEWAGVMLVRRFGRSRRRSTR